VVRKKITELCLQCCKNIREEKSGFWFSAEELEGVPKDVMGRFKREGGEGKYWVSFKEADLTPCFEYAVNSETRKLLWLASGNEYVENVDLMKELVALRAEAAGLLGFGSHAEYVSTLGAGQATLTENI
jgi:metallopeptidase MepB